MRHFKKDRGQIKTDQSCFPALCILFPAFHALAFFLCVAGLQFCHPNQKQMNTQQPLTQTENNISNLISAAQLKNFYRQSIQLGSLLSVSVYGLVRLLFHDIPFEILEETALILQVLFTGWVLAACCIGGLNMLFFPAASYIRLSKICAAQMVSWYSKSRKTVSSTMEQKRIVTVKRVNIESPEMMIRF